MKAEFVDQSQKEQEWKFPCLGIGNDGWDLVLFAKNNEGVVIANPHRIREIGFYSCSWDMEDFKPIPTSQKVILQND